MINMVRFLQFSFVVSSLTTPVAAQEIAAHSLGNALEAQVISVDGPIEPGLTERLAVFLDEEFHEGYRLRLNSDGGSLMEGLQLGRLIRDRGLRTEVGRIVSGVSHSAWPVPEEAQGRCLSACALAFLGGIVREEGSAEALGFHQFYGGVAANDLWARDPLEVYADAVGGSQAVSGLIVAYILEMGVDARVFIEASRSGPSEMTFLTRDQAIDYQVVTPEGFGSWFIEPYKDGIIAASQRLGPTRAYDQVHQTTLFCHEGRPSEAILMMTADAGWFETGSAAEAEGEVLIRSTDGVETIFKIPVERIALRSVGETTWIEFLINAAGIQGLLNASEVGVVWKVARASGGYSSWHRIIDRDREMIRSAFMHCI